jgi:hypothetical protein
MGTHKLVSKNGLQTVDSVLRIMATIFWKAEDLLLVNSVPRGETVTTAHCCNMLDRLRGAVQRKRLQQLNLIGVYPEEPVFSSWTVTCFHAICQK